MLNGRNEYRVYSENDEIEVAFAANIGDREEQQDCSGYELEDDYNLFVVCDGMGGMQGGRNASHLAVGELLTRYRLSEKDKKPSCILREIIPDIDSKIAALHMTDGTLLNAGTTMVATLVTKKKLYWTSIGDSRIYVKRGNDIVLLTRDHNYENLLRDKLKTGNVTQAFYDTQTKKQKASLTSYLGMNGLSIVSGNDIPIQLVSGDQILLTTDGLYKMLSTEEINNVLSSFSNLEDAARALESNWYRNGKTREVKRDNFTIALIRIK